MISQMISYSQNYDITHDIICPKSSDIIYDIIYIIYDIMYIMYDIIYDIMYIMYDIICKNYDIAYDIIYDGIFSLSCANDIIPKTMISYMIS
jgi:hypothetical protein